MSQDIDKRIAVEVMGWTVADHPEKHGTGQWMSEYGFPVYYDSDGRYREACSFCPSADMAAAMEVVAKLRDQWTEATKEAHGNDDEFERPFDDHVFFEHLQRDADRRWPWAFLYVTPLAICEAALEAQQVPDVTKQPSRPGDHNNNDVGCD
jgi:Phage ABA sandwich domain